MRERKNNPLIGNIRKYNFKKDLHVLGLIMICIVIFISHTLYVFKTHQYPEQEEHSYLSYAVNFYDILKKPTFDSYFKIIDVIPYRQPLYGLFISIPLLIFGTAYTYKIALWINVLFYIGSIIGIYLMSREFLSKTSSLLSSFIFAFYGSTLFYLHFTYVETAVTTFIVFSILFLARSNYFNNTKNTVISAIFFSLGMFTRWVIPFFMGGALIVAFLFGIIREFKKKKKNPKNFVINLLLFILIGLIIPFLIYYLPNLPYISDYFISQTQHSDAWISQFFSPELQDLTNTLSTRSVMFYLNIFSQQTIFFWILFVFGFLIGIKNFRKYIFLITIFVFAYSSFTFFSVLKFDRYIVPIYPIIAVISAITFDHIKIISLRRVLIIATIVIGFLNFLGASWGIGPMGKQGLKDIVLPEIIRHPRRIYLTPLVWPPREEELNAEDTISFIQKDFVYAKGKPMVIITFEHHPYGNAIYKILVYEKRDKMSVLNTRDIDFKTLFNHINRSDYLLVKDKNPIDNNFNDPNVPMYNQVKVMRAFNNTLEIEKDIAPLPFNMVKKTSIPLDKTNILVYKKMENITREQWLDYANILIKSNKELESEITREIGEFLLTLDE